MLNHFKELVVWTFVKYEGGTVCFRFAPKPTDEFQLTIDRAMARYCFKEGSWLDGVPFNSGVVENSWGS